MARPPAPIDWDRVEKALIAGCSGVEIAGRFGIHPNTLYRQYEEKYNISFSEAAHSKRCQGDGLIKERQYASAMNGNTAMLTLLGKERLGQGKSGENNDVDLRGYIALTQELKELKAALLSGGIVLPGVSLEQPLPHQGSAREQDQIPDELGTKDSMERGA